MAVALYLLAAPPWLCGPSCHRGDATARGRAAALPCGDLDAGSRRVGSMVAFTVSDLNAWATRLKSLGVRFQILPMQDPEDNTRSFIVLDNGVNWLQFTTARPGGHRAA